MLRCMSDPHRDPEDTDPHSPRSVAITFVPLLVVLCVVAAFLVGCPWLVNDHCTPNTTRCAPQRHAAQVCGPAGSTRWVDSQECPERSTTGEEVVCCYVSMPERNFSGHACMPRSRCTEPPAFERDAR